MAACEENRARASMGAHEGNRGDQGVNLPTKTKNSSAPRLSPYAKRSTTQRQERKPASNPNPGAVSRASKARIIFRSPSRKPTCTSAPATKIRLPGERQPATNSPPKAKQGVSNMSHGMPRDRWSAPLTQPHHQRQATYMMVPVRLKKAGLKLLDPEQVKNLTSFAAATHFESGEQRLQSDLHQAQTSKQCSLNSRHKAILRFPAKQRPSSRKSTGGILGRRQDSNLSIKQKKTTYEDLESHLLTHQMDGLVLNEKDGSESKSWNTDQESYNPQISPQPMSNQKCVSKHDEASWTDSNSLEEPNNYPLEQLTSQTVSTSKKEISLDHVNKDVKEVDLDLGSKIKEIIQEQLLEGDKVLDSDLHPSRKENYESEELQLEEASDDLSQSQVDALNNPQGNASTKIQSQKDTISDHDHLKKSPSVETKSQPIITSSHQVLTKSPRASEVDSTDERCLEEAPKKISMDFGQSSSPAEENIGDMGAPSSQEDTKSKVSLKGNDVIRKSQGVLVLTRSTDENAIFIPKLKFEFTPDNSIDWTALSQNNRRDQVKVKESRTTKPCTPRGPSFSKSVLRKSGYIPTAEGNSESTAGSFGAERSTKDSSTPLHRIVDLSLSFQGKYEGDEIPQDIPKILLMEEDSDED